MTERPNYLAVFTTFARNSLIREMTFRWNFILDCISSLSWVVMQLGFYLLIFEHTREIGSGTGWEKWQFFVFLSTTLFINSAVQMLFMTNMDEFSDQVRTGNLDFVLLKPIDPQFLVSLRKFEWSSLSNLLFAAVLLSTSLAHLDYRPTAIQAVLYVAYLGCGVAMMYSLMVVLGSLSVWLGRNESLYDFWFYITNFARYPMEIYQGPVGTPLRLAFTFVVPILLVVNVPARLMAWPLASQDWRLAAAAIVATAAGFYLARRMFLTALRSYRSASS